MSDIIKGIVCPACRKSSLKKELKIWVCERCNHTTKTNLQKAVEQYLLVVKPTINNKEFRDFFGVESVKSANNLLAPLILKKHGGKRNRFYSLMEPINF